jgi:hypothetical protein
MASLQRGLQCRRVLQQDIKQDWKRQTTKGDGNTLISILITFASSFVPGKRSKERRAESARWDTPREWF